MSAPALRLKGLTVRYPDSPPAVDQLDFTLAAGERVAVVGANGAGKSTLLMTLCGLLPIHAGAAWVHGVEVAPRSEALRRQVGFVFQDPDDQLFMPTVLDDARLSAEQVEATNAERRALVALERFGLLHLRQRPLHQLSGGEKRLVAIASTLAAEPKLLLMDEPSANLDPRARRRLIQALLKADRSQLIATHDLELALEVCHRVLVLKRGARVAVGPPQNILGDEALMQRCDLERPSSLRACPACGWREEAAR